MMLAPVLRRLAVACLTVFVVAFILSLGAALQKAHAHDFYGDAVSKTGTLCCGGDPRTGDCEALDATQINVRASGIRIFSKRYGVWVEIAESAVQWTSPPGEPEPPAAGHWCGKPRAGLNAPYLNGPTEGDPDPSIHTYCVFLVPPGM